MSSPKYAAKCASMRASPSRKRRRYSSSNVRNSKPCHLQVGQLYRLWHRIVSCDTLTVFPDEKGTKKSRTQGQIFSTRHRPRACSEGAPFERPFFMPLSCASAKCNERQGFLMSAGTSS